MKQNIRSELVLQTLDNARTEICEPDLALFMALKGAEIVGVKKCGDDDSNQRRRRSRKLDSGNQLSMTKFPHTRFP